MARPLATVALALGIVIASDASASPRTQDRGGRIDIGVTNTLAVGTGLLLLNDTTVNGASALFMVGGGGVTLVSQIGTTFVASSTPASGQIGVYFDATNYRVNNNVGQSVTLGTFTVKTRAAN